jgi:putative protease
MKNQGRFTRNREGAHYPDIPELLAPGGSPEAFRAAINAGADAVYVSGRRFGARKFAQNFSEDELKDAINQAHTRGVRVYVTVNTLLKDREIADAVDYLIRLWSMGADAVLIQDRGLAALARQYVPDLVLHASTQMTIHNTEGVRQAAALGFSRVVLARELDLEAVRRIICATQDAGIGAEVFCHGALCYGYSGQCLFSSVLGGRSGNRGTCAQPCRKPYDMVVAGIDKYGRPNNPSKISTVGQYLLSTRDLCTYPRLRELAGSGIASIKIEGRMRSPEYVAIAVSIYRNALDAIAAGEWAPDPSSYRDLELTFSRGFTKGHLFSERNSALMGRDAPDKRGIRLGTVTGFDPKMRVVLIRPDGDLIPDTGDGLLISRQGDRKSEVGFALNNAPVKRSDGTIVFAVPAPVEIGAILYLTSSRQLASRARRIVSGQDTLYARKIPLDIAVTVDRNGVIGLTGASHNARGEDVIVGYTPGTAMQAARTRPTTRDEMRQQLEKTGKTPFRIQRISEDYPGNLFMPVSELNQIRRDFLTRAEENLAASTRPDIASVEETRMQWVRDRDRIGGINQGYLPERGLHPPEIIVYADTPEIASGAAAAGCNAVCYEPGISAAGYCRKGGKVQGETPWIDEIGIVARACTEHGVRCVLMIPKIATDLEIDDLEDALSHIRRTGVSGFLAEDAGSASTVRKADAEIVLHGGPGLNIFNHHTALCLEGQFASCTLSPELSIDAMRTLIAGARQAGSTIRFDAVIQGNLEIMVAEDCILEPHEGCRRKQSSGGMDAFTGIQDETGRIFTTRIDSMCRTHILNSAETCLIDRLPQLLDAGITGFIIDARGRTQEYFRDMTRLYRSALDMLSGGAPDQKQLTALREEAGKRSLGGITSIHAIRGVPDA